MWKICRGEPQNLVNWPGEFGVVPNYNLHRDTWTHTWVNVNETPPEGMLVGAI